MENCPAWLLLPPRVPLRQQHFCLAELGNDFLGPCHVLTIIFLTSIGQTLALHLGVLQGHSTTHCCPTPSLTNNRHHRVHSQLRQGLEPLILLLTASTRAS